MQQRGDGRFAEEEVDEHLVPQQRAAPSVGDPSDRLEQLDVGHALGSVAARGRRAEQLDRGQVLAAEGGAEQLEAAACGERLGVRFRRSLRACERREESVLGGRLAAAPRLLLLPPLAGGTGGTGGDTGTDARCNEAVLPVAPRPLPLVVWRAVRCVGRPAAPHAAGARVARLEARAARAVAADADSAHLPPSGVWEVEARGC